MVTKEDVERYYAEKLGKNYDTDIDAVPNYISTYFSICGLDSDEKGLYYAFYDCFDHERVYATFEEIKADIQKKLDIDIAFLQKLRGL